MTVWLAAEIALLLPMLACAWVIFRNKGLSDCLVALQMAGIIGVLALVILAQAMHRPSFYDLALTLSLLSFPAALVSSHFVERWLQ